MTSTASPGRDRLQGPAADPVRHPTAPMIFLGGLAWILATVQYAGTQLVVAAEWNPPYSWLGNYISDLGNTACGMFAVPRATPAYVCSPLHAVMNTSFVVAGLLTVAGAVLLRHWWPSGRLPATALLLWVVAGLGKIIVGVFPENGNAGLHLLGALNLPIGSVAILLLGLSVLRVDRAVGVTSVVVAVVGLAGAFLSTAGQYAGSSLYLGAGAGGMERIAGYPANLWVLMIGIIAILRVRRPA